MIILTPYEYYILKSALDAFRSEDSEDDGDPIIETMLNLQHKLFGSNSEGADNLDEESIPPSIVIGPMAWAFEPDVHMQLCDKTTQYKRTSNEKYRKKVLVGL